ncbi:MAG: hypothetical protein II333_04290 [Clostridia bacterium]|nr:hypothetical protein [Clostridia bacterium]
MNRPRYIWWRYIKTVIRRYADCPDVLSDSEFSAVQRAVEFTRVLPDGDLRMRLVRLVLWDRTHTVAGAALVLYISESTAQDWHAQFIKSAAVCMGLKLRVTEPKKRGIIRS